MSEVVGASKVISASVEQDLKAAAALDLTEARGSLTKLEDVFLDKRFGKQLRVTRSMAAVKQFTSAVGLFIYGGNLIDNIPDTAVSSVSSLRLALHDMTQLEINTGFDFNADVESDKDKDEGKDLKADPNSGRHVITVMHDVFNIKFLDSVCTPDRVAGIINDGKATLDIIQKTWADGLTSQCDTLEKMIPAWEASEAKLMENEELKKALLTNPHFQSLSGLAAKLQSFLASLVKLQGDGGSKMIIPVAVKRARELCVLATRTVIVTWGLYQLASVLPQVVAAERPAAVAKVVKQIAEKGGGVPQCVMNALQVLGKEQNDKDKK